jgi:hypothetical protein
MEARATALSGDAAGLARRTRARGGRKFIAARSVEERAMPVNSAGLSTMR